MVTAHLSSAVGGSPWDVTTWDPSIPISPKPIASKMIEATEKAVPEWYQRIRNALNSSRGVVIFFAR